MYSDANIAGVGGRYANAVSFDYRREKAADLWLLSLSFKIVFHNNHFCPQALLFSPSSNWHAAPLHWERSVETLLSGSSGNAAMPWPERRYGQQRSKTA